MKKTLAFLCLLAIATSLLNSAAFGNPSLIAYFLFTILACFTGVLTFGKMAFTSQHRMTWPPLHILIFLTLAIYVLIHGMARHSLNLEHYSWAAMGIFLFALHGWTSSPAFDQRLRLRLFQSLAVLALSECIVIMLQWAAVIHTPNPLFAASGTWTNPNVTAMYLALSLFAVQYAADHTRGIWQRIYYGILLITIVCIALLFCRSAYLAATLILGVRHWPLIRSRFTRLGFNRRGFVALLIAAYAIMAIYSFFSMKEASARGRLQVWQNSLEMIREKPMTGYGFGMFEKEYNLFAAKKKSPANDHIHIAYNDVLQLGVEGGVMAAMLWLAFLTAFVRYCLRKGRSTILFLPTLLAFIIMQLTNFVFHAIPVMVLFLLYTALISRPVPQKEGSPERTGLKPGRRTVAGRMIGISVGLSAGAAAVLLLFNQCNLLSLYYRSWMIDKTYPASQSIAAYRSLNGQMDNSSWYHERYGDALLELKHYPQALQQYSAALRSNSYPNLFYKAGYCWQMLNRCDSSERYYRLVEDMQPQKLSPRIALLRLYTFRKDTVRMIAKAEEILDMPVRIYSRKATDIKKYAKDVLLSCKPNSSLIKIN